MKKYTDTEILDWLQNGCDGSFSSERIWDPYNGCYKKEWQIFTVPSQHVKGENIRDAFIKAINKAPNQAVQRNANKDGVR